MKILFVGQEPRYRSIVRELRKNHDVDYVFKGVKFEIDNGDYLVPKFMGFHRGYKVLACLITSCLLLTKKYDVCVADYKSAYLPTVFPMISFVTKKMHTKFVFDIRTIPVCYAEHMAQKEKNAFFKQLRFANRFYQGITVITGVMEKHISENYMPFLKPTGVWESGVDVSEFVPRPKDLTLKKELGFEDEDFICFYHGSVDYRRGVVELVKAIQKLAPDVARVKLFILGGGASCDQIRSIVADNDLHQSIKVHDWVDIERVPYYISIADLCIIPLADIEWWRVSSPFKLMEYIACGKNILLTEIVAHTNVVGEDSNYYWVKQVSPEELANNISLAYKDYMSDPNEYYYNGIFERKRFVEKISWESRASVLTNYFNNLSDFAH